MKKLIAIMLLFALVLSCCACQKQEAQSQSGELDVYADIDETVMQDGVYKIHSIRGIENMAAHPEASFEVIRDIDLGGAVLSPIGTKENPFTGSVNGNNFVISNFTVRGGEDVGFFGGLDGDVKNLHLKDMTVEAGADTRNVGGLAGVFTGQISRCVLTGTIVTGADTKELNCGGLFGSGSGHAIYTNIDMDVNCIGGKTNAGGLAGSVTGGSIMDCETAGTIDVTGSGKTMGLVAGCVQDANIERCVFLGESNTQDGKLYIEFVGQNRNTSVVDCLRRDNSAAPLAPNVQALRDKVESTMRAMGTIQWTVSEVLYHDCSCALAVCHGAFHPETIYQGIPYNHKAGSLDRFLYCFDENMVAKDWVYDTLAFEGHDMYMGNDCSTAIQKSWLTVSNSITFTGASQEIPDRNMGTIPVGDWTWDLGKQAWYTIDYIKATDEQVMYEAYAQLRKGDAITYSIEEGGHTRMCATDAVVVRDEAGNIAPEYSYALFHEQGAPVSYEPYYTTWRIDYKYTFANLLMADAVPVTMEELLTGEMEPAEASLVGGTTGKAGLTTGKVVANYAVDSVTMVITDGAGNQVFNHRMFPGVGKHEDHSNNSVYIRKVTYEYDLSFFALPLRYVPFAEDGSYHCTVTANLATGDRIQVLDYSF